MSAGVPDSEQGRPYDHIDLGQWIMPKVFVVVLGIMLSSASFIEPSYSVSSENRT